MKLKSLRNYLVESKDMLDISIQAAAKYLTSDKKRIEFLTTEVTVEAKTDGVKISAVKVQNNGTAEDYIIAYKGNILYASEYDYQPDAQIKNSIGASQFKKVFKHFNKLGSNNIPVGTELFIEYLMQKPTLSSNYTKKHRMVLIAHSPCTYTVKFGKLKTKPTGFFTNKRIEFAKALKVSAPLLLFKGIMGSEIQFSKGIKYKELQTKFNASKNSFDWDTPELLIDNIRVLLLDIESEFGGVEEGVVLIFKERILKFQQEYQVDQAARLQIKMKYRQEDPEVETLYWNNVTRTAFEIANSIDVKERQLEEVMKELAILLKKYKLDFENDKKVPAIIKDDIQLNVKTLLIKKMKGNNNALILGKFRVLTEEGHAKLIKRASLLYDKVVICMVTSKDTKSTKDLRTKMMQKAFPNVEIIHASTGNLITILNKSPININVIYAGSDRVQAYRTQLKSTTGVSVKELPRDDSDISASKVIENIADEAFFKANTPKSIHSMYNEILQAYT